MKFPDKIQEVASTKLTLVRRICSVLPGTTEKLSHGEPTFFVDKRVYAMFSDSHHNGGLVAVWVPVPEGYQSIFLQSDQHKYFLPPYVGKQGWIGIDLTEVSETELLFQLETAWTLKKKRPTKFST